MMCPTILGRSLCVFGASPPTARPTWSSFPSSSSSCHSRWKSSARGRSRRTGHIMGIALFRLIQIYHSVLYKIWYSDIVNPCQCYIILYHIRVYCGTGSVLNFISNSTFVIFWWPRMEDPLLSLDFVCLGWSISLAPSNCFAHLLTPSRKSRLETSISLDV